MRAKTSYTRKHAKTYIFTCIMCHAVALTVYRTLFPSTKWAGCCPISRADDSAKGGWVPMPMITRKEAATYLRVARRQGASISVVL